MSELRRRTGVKLAAGQNEAQAFRFRDMLLHDAVDYVQPICDERGGYSQAIKIAGLAQAFNIGLQNGGAGALQNMHLHAGVSRRRQLRVASAVHADERQALSRHAEGRARFPDHPQHAGPRPRGRSGRGQGIRGQAGLTRPCEEALSGAPRSAGVLREPFGPALLTRSASCSTGALSARLSSFRAEPGCRAGRLDVRPLGLFSAAAAAASLGLASQADGFPFRGPAGFRDRSGWDRLTVGLGWKRASMAFFASVGCGDAVRETGLFKIRHGSLGCGFGSGRIRRRARRCPLHSQRSPV